MQPLQVNIDIEHEIHQEADNEEGETPHGNERRLSYLKDEQDVGL